MNTLTLAVLFLGLLLLLYAIGVPVAFAMGLASVLMMAAPFGPEFQLSILSNELFYGLNSFGLLALPFYLFLGRIMNRAGLTEEMFDFAGSLVGQFRGGIAYVNVVASILFSGMSGLATADAAGLGRVEYKSMRDAGYEKDFSLGLTGASATIGPIIPPSVPLIIYGVLAEVSIGALFLGGVIPGLLLGTVLMIFVAILARLRGYQSGDSFALKRVFNTFTKALPALFIPLLIVGGILQGYFTATEAGAMAVLYAVVIAYIYGDLSASDLATELRDSAIETFSLTIIISMATMYGLVALQMRIPIFLAESITAVSSDPTVIMLLFVGLFIVVGTFMNVTPSLIILVPILLPVAQNVGIDLLHLGVVMVLTLTFGLVTPPLGVVLFVLEKVTDADLEDAMRGIAPFYIPLALILLIIAIFPETVTFIPKQLMG
ncbi:TRAP transporter large permease [Haloarcula amylovorans]|uniref:TRAP transporter large permease n=1 Tax=Haloarcula amylovorans TaxID=2562280 RepID=UPI001075E37E|nr:TRAP transporter large permease [Halomicroarcula amylolytica]